MTVKGFRNEDGDLLLVPSNVVETNDIEALDSIVINNLRAGDVVLKVDSTGKHAYHVTFKNATGMCLTYADAENVETIAFDKTGDVWEKTDKTVTGITGKAAADHNHDTVYVKDYGTNIAITRDEEGAYLFPVNQDAAEDILAFIGAVPANKIVKCNVVLYTTGASVTTAVAGFAYWEQGTGSRTIHVTIGNTTMSAGFQYNDVDDATSYTFNDEWTKTDISSFFETAQ